MRIFAIIPAAGCSERMGLNKLLLPWGQRTLIEHVLNVWQQGGVDARIVVVHPDDYKLADLCREAGATVCVPTAPPPEMKDSVQAALALAAELLRPSHDDAWMLAPADLPLLSAELIGKLIEIHSRKVAPVVAPRLPDGHAGHPVLFSWQAAHQIGHLTGGVRDLMHRHPAAFVEWHDADSFSDVDTADDYLRLHNRYVPAHT